MLRPRNLARLSHRVEQLAGSVHDASLATTALRRQVEHSAEGVKKEVARDLALAGRETARLVKQHAASVARHDEDLSAVRQQLATVAEQLAAVGTSVAGVAEKLVEQSRRSDQLVAAYCSDAQRKNDIDRALRIFSAPDIEAHARRAIETAVVRDDPFPHAFIEHLLPEEAYDHLVNALPPRVFFEDRPVNKQQLVVSFPFAPAYSRAVWDRFKVLADAVIGPAVQARFQEHIDAYLRHICPALGAERLAFNVSDGRIMLRRPGYVIAPHRDPKKGFIAVLMNLARKGDPERYGTQIYRVKEDREAPSLAPFWIDAAKCELVGEVPFRRNTALVFLSSTGAHGASIPADAPPDIERYQFQFRVGPEAADLRRLVKLMPPEARAMWTAAKTESPGPHETY